MWPVVLALQGGFSRPRSCLKEPMIVCAGVNRKLTSPLRCTYSMHFHPDDFKLFILCCIRHVCKKEVHASYPLSVLRCILCMPAPARIAALDPRPGCCWKDFYNFACPCLSMCHYAHFLCSKAMKLFMLLSLVSAAGCIFFAGKQLSKAVSCVVLFRCCSIREFAAALCIVACHECSYS